MRKICFPLLLLTLFFSCQTEIKVTIPDYYNKMVVEGYIENGEYPVVSLYRSVPYFSTISWQTLRDSILIRDAKVFVSSSLGEEQELFINPIWEPNDEYPLRYAYSTNKLVGKTNTTYRLRIVWDSKEYRSDTKILDVFDLDSVFFVPNFGHNKIDSVANLRIAMTDDGKLNNYYQFKVKIHCPDFQDKLWVSTIPAAFDNSPFRGISFNYEIMRGSPSIFTKEMGEQEQRRYYRMNYRIGDTVHLKYARLDEGGFRFWQSAGDEIIFGQNPFLSPSPILSNITCSTGEKCLGVWCGSAKKEIVMVLDTTTAKASCSTLGVR